MCYSGEKNKNISNETTNSVTQTNKTELGQSSIENDGNLNILCNHYFMITKFFKILFHLLFRREKSKYFK